jgi:7,8-dihydro-6-hydroxymethylpterin dimethyltransferase
MTELQSRTASLCPHCFRRIPADRIIENDAVYLQKSCPEHGDLGKILLWKNSPKPFHEWTRAPSEAAGVSCTSGSSSDDMPIAAKEQSGCPYSCGLCLNHQQKTCTVIVEVTGRCALRCPICFAASKTEANPDPDLGQIAQIFEMLRDRADHCPVQLSGGEPSLRDDLPQIVALARTLGFDHIQINTNGIRLAQDADYARALMDAGATVIYLQFDGITNSVYQHIRGADLLSLKLKAIERCAELKIGVILVPTLVKGVNDGQIGAIIQVAKKWMPIVKGVHFQPMAFLGRHPTPPRNDDRVLISDLLAAIEDQTGGELRVENLIPSG